MYINRVFGRPHSKLSLRLLACLCFVVVMFVPARANPRAGRVRRPQKIVAPGTVIARGSNRTPTGALKVKTYRLEADGQEQFRLTVSMDNDDGGAHLVWINDDPRYAEPTNKGEVSATFPLAWLEDGATLSVSTPGKPYELSRLKEKLTLPGWLKRQRRAAAAPSMKVTSIRRVSREEGGAQKAFIVIEVTSSAAFHPVIANNTWVMQIGRKEFSASVDFGTVYKMVCVMTPEEFAGLADGDPIRLNWGFGALGTGIAGKSFGRLRKDMLHRQTHAE